MNSTKPATLVPVVAAIALTTAGGGVARAHFDLDSAGTHRSRSGRSEIKARPCGRAGSTRGANVSTYRPGSTITIAVDEFISHPGYYRIAFDPDGDDGFADPATISGEFGNCSSDPKCGPGMTDFCNNDTVLLDNLDPHAVKPFPANLMPTRFTWSVKLPDVECNNCTLQIIQVMTDLNIHPAPYPDDDIYYQCIDLVLSNSAPETNDAPMMNNGIDCKAGAPNAGAGGAGAAGAGGVEAPDGGTPSAGTMAMPPVEAGAGGAAAAGTGGAGDPGSAGGAAGTTAGLSAPPTEPAAGSPGPGSASGGSSGCATIARGESGASAWASASFVLALAVLGLRRRVSALVRPTSATGGLRVGARASTRHGARRTRRRARARTRSTTRRSR
jgi:hypothetical protein